MFKLGRKRVAPQSDSADVAKQESQRVQDLIKDQQHQLELQLRLLALHEQVGIDQHEVAISLSTHHSPPIRVAGMALVKLGTDHLSRLPRQLLEGNATASVTFKQFIGKTHHDFGTPAESATELLVYRLQTVAAMIGQVAAGRTIDADEIAFQAANDVDVLMSNERTRQKMSREKKPRV